MKERTNPKSEIKKILIVDDDAELRTSLFEILKGAGYLTDEASSGKEAIEKVRSSDFDVVLLDIMMPKMSGIETLLELKKFGSKVRIIMITAFATIENAVDAIRKGASDYISKPFKIDDLLITIRRVLEEAKFEKDIKNLDMDYALSSLANSIRRRIIKLLGVKADMHFVEIARELGIEREHTKLVFHLKILKESGIIEQDKKKLYLLTKEGERILYCLKLMENYISQ